ncbi:transcriptional regulator [Paractinoplanes abujensis]|uniref:DNA-binding MarR family transcriptional regulator n=1 Tax=Paractinoplanes abujensis TaxID=882441 RepID=A0A7W7D0E1_9ACTN|nr:MarR family winged helix-turn-helix transcriptional regulator [Actinoplanes abujensis]MBB4696920.1 DNA-binding MarR family transcriptional regulator [Actinoplanes abujensis]GID18608.1 transcriptional regulator [Actinoplanes abujensis]
MTPADPLTDTWSPDQTAAMQHLHDWTVGFIELNQHLAAWMALPTSDASALSNIVWAAEQDTPLSPADLSRRIGMTSGATTVLLNRLEAGGHITRTREHPDRRRVTLRPTPQSRTRARTFLAHAGAEVAEVLHHTTPEDLRRITTFLARLTSATAKANTRLQAHPTPPAGDRPPPDHPADTTAVAPGPVRRSTRLGVVGP